MTTVDLPAKDHLTAVELLAAVQRLGLKIWADGDQLRVRGATGALTPELRTAIQQHKLELLRVLRGATTADEPPQRAPRPARLPLSFGQERLWLLDQWHPGSATYNLPYAIRLAGRLDVPRLQRSFQRIIERHEILRTTFLSPSSDASGDDDHPAQVIAPELHIPLPVVDLPARYPAESHAERIARAWQLARDEGRQPFDLQRGPLLRTTLLRLHPEGSGDEHWLLLTLHHIIADGWSMGVLIRELAAHYTASDGSLAALSAEDRPLPLQYADYALWQRRTLTPPALEQQLRYWRQHLGPEGTPAPPTLQLPTDRPRPLVQTFAGATERRLLDRSLAAALKALSRDEGVTLFMTLLAAFNVLLYRHTGQTDLVVGTPIANRRHAALEGLIGFFVNTLALRTDLSGRPSFRALLRRVQQVALAAYAHQDLPFEKLVEALEPERSPSYSPIFQVLFVLQNAPLPALDLPGLRLAPLDLPSGSAKFDLTLWVAEQPATLEVALEYNTDLFDAATIERMLTQLHTLLAAIVATPDAPIDRLPLLTAAELRRLVVDWNATDASYPAGQGLHELIAAQAARTPDAVAVVFEERSLSYAELDARANRLAHHLAALGVGGHPQHESRVGVCLDRSPDLIVAILGILKAGGAWVPLDPAYPDDRLRFMLDDAGIAVLLTHAPLAARLAELLPDRAAPQPAPTIVDLDLHRSVIAACPARDPGRRAHPEQLAYVIYTSGSTGRPKGTLVPHRGLGNLAQAQIAAFGVGPTSRVLQFASISFDAAVAEIAMALLAGATLVLAPPARLLPGPALIDLLREQRISVVTLPPSLLALLPPAECPTLQTIISAGEACPAEVAARWGADGRRFCNAYGPTETTVCATISGDAQAAPPPSIGRPISNTQIYILDAQMQPVPIGVPGELYIGGAGVARGYHKRRDLTAEKFVPNPFGHDNFGFWIGDFGLSQSQPPIPNPQSKIQNSSRLYKTGDLARYRADGQIEFLGRIDDQVKLRGFRIELGEIEQVLQQYPGVRQAVVVVRERAPGQQQLIAYLVLDESDLTDHRPPTTDYRAFLAGKLPAYMLPSAFVIVPALPLTPSGKVDRRALPAPPTDDDAPRAAFVAPRTPTETVLAAIWAEVLARPAVGIHDNFFALGGDSLLTMKMLRRAQLAGLQLTPRQLLEHQTVAELAAVAVALDASGTTAQETGPAPLTPAQKWFFDQDLPDAHQWNTSLLLEPQIALEPALLEQSIRHLLTQHDALRARFQRTADGWQQWIGAVEEQVPFGQIDLGGVPEERQAAALAAAIDEIQRSLDLQRGPLLRIVLFERGPQRTSRLLIVFHHALVDGVSIGILLEDFQTAYRQLREGATVRLLPTRTSFKQWTERLRTYTGSAALQAERAYWLAPERMHAPPLPVDHPGGVNSGASARRVVAALDADETRRLIAATSRPGGPQLADVLFTALAAACRGWTRRRTLWVTVTSHGRDTHYDDIDLSRTVGWLSIGYPLLIECAPEASVPALLPLIREQLRRIPGRGVGYSLLWNTGDPELVAALRRQPQPEMVFNYTGQDHSTNEAAALFRPAPEPTGEILSPEQNRPHLLHINAVIDQGRLQTEWWYSSNLHRPATIERLAADYLAALRTLGEL